MEKVQSVNGFVINLLSKDEVNEKLIEKGDWSIAYYVPGRRIHPYFITINRQRYYFETLDEAIDFCKNNNKEELKQKEYYELLRILCTSVSS